MRRREREREIAPPLSLDNSMGASGQDGKLNDGVNYMLTVVTVEQGDEGTYDSQRLL